MAVRQGWYASELVGYMGEYQIHRDATPLPAKPKCPVLHLEVFTGDQLSNFLEKSRVYANSVQAKDKSRLRVLSGVRLVSRSDTDRQIGAGVLLQATKDSPSGGAWAKVQPMSRGTSGSPRDSVKVKQGPPLWVERRLSNTTTTVGASAWLGFPLQAANQKEDSVAFERIFSREQLDNASDADKAQDDEGVRWWRVAAPGVSANDICGWVCEKGHVGTRWESRWAWPGFNLVDCQNVSMVDLFKRGCQLSGSVFHDEKEEFKAIARELGGSRLIEQVEQAIGQRENLQGSVSRVELSVAMRKSWFAANLSRIIVRYESEWSGAPDKWGALTQHMREKKGIWEVEMARIRRLQWWSDVQSITGFPTSKVVYHIHPLGLIENFMGVLSDCEVRFEKLTNIVLRFEGGYTDDPHDSGGKTNCGISWEIWQATAQKILRVEPSEENLRRITLQQAKAIYLETFWKPGGYCQINDERLALIIYDWTITSGGAVRTLQNFLKNNYEADIKVDGIMGTQMRGVLIALSDRKDIVAEIAALRKEYYSDQTIGPRKEKNKRFLKGWWRRVDDCLIVKL